MNESSTAYGAMSFANSFFHRFAVQTRKVAALSLKSCLAVFRSSNCFSISSFVSLVGKKKYFELMNLLLFLVENFKFFPF